MHYVYILPCSDRKYMKIGVSSTDLERIITHHKSYNILIDSSRFIFPHSRRLAYKLENYLLNKIPKPKRHDLIKIKDGSSELRDISYARDIKNILNGIKTDPFFGYNESLIDYKLYNIKDFILKAKSNTLLESEVIDKQYESLKERSKRGRVEVLYSHHHQQKRK